ncbi:MAG: glycoside hydrolase family 15 protein, partial [Dehalococcoidia bacterium]
FPTIDMPQLRDIQLLVSDSESFLHSESSDLITTSERLSDHALGYNVRNADPAGRYLIAKDVISNPHLPAILQHVRIEGSPEDLSGLSFYVLAAPHLGGGGWGNRGQVVEVAGRTVLVAEGDGTWLALAASIPFARTSCGFVGYSDGWTDLASNFAMDWAFDQANDGNIALTGELSFEGNAPREFTVALAFGHSLNNALSTLLQSLAVPFEEHKERFIAQWDRICQRLLPLEDSAFDGGDLYHGSYSVLLAHEDKTYPGALIASLAIPWGDAKGDEDRGGYHLVWTRDLVNNATGLLAAGNLDTPFRALVYLMALQSPDGGFPQNAWIDGQPYWNGIQLDEVAFPILLARHLRDARALQGLDPYPMVKAAAAFLVRNGPATAQERWEEASGYSPSTLAACIAALICAAGFARDNHDEATACFLETYADFLECHLEDWTVTTDGDIVPELPRHFIRIHPVLVDDFEPLEDPNSGSLKIANRADSGRSTFPAREIVDAGFLELVRYGVRSADDPLIIDSLRVVDSVLKVETPFGPSWRRYNHDGYGQGIHGEPFIGVGVGRAWPLLTGERAHYQLARDGETKPLLMALERFASECGLLPEQVWDAPALPEKRLVTGGATGSASPLMWAHAEYIKLLRSIHDGQVFDRIPEVEQRYAQSGKQRQPLEIWKPNRRIRSLRRGSKLRIQAPETFRLHWSPDRWVNVTDSLATSTELGIHYVDVSVPDNQSDPIFFTFYWPQSDRWEGRNYQLTIEDDDHD